MTQEQVVIQALKNLGGSASLKDIENETFKIPDCMWNTKTRDASIRRIVQKSSYIKNISRGIWSLSKAPLIPDTNTDAPIILTTTIEPTHITNKVLLYSITSEKIDWKKLSIYKNLDDSIEYEISNCDEYTYCINDGGSTQIKIGKTKNITDRLAQLKTSNPSIYIQHVFPKDQYSESELHDRFIHSKNDLEWYFQTRSVRDFLNKEIKNTECILNTYNSKLILKKSEEEMLQLIK